MRIVDQNVGHDESTTPSGRWTTWPAGTPPSGVKADPAVDRGDIVCLERSRLSGRPADGVRRGVGEGQRRDRPSTPRSQAVGPGWADLDAGGASQTLAGSTEHHHSTVTTGPTTSSSTPTAMSSSSTSSSPGEGSASYDLAYFVTQSLAPDVAATHEAALFNRWRRRPHRRWGARSRDRVRCGIGTVRPPSSVSSTRSWPRRGMDLSATNVSTDPRSTT